MTIQELINKYEAFKEKGFKITEQDLFDWLKLQDDMKDKVVELKSQYLEKKLQTDKDYGLKLIELKELKDFDGKKKYTDSTAKAFCDKAFFDNELELIGLKASYEMLSNKAEQCIEYINVIKLNMRKDFSI